MTKNAQVKVINPPGGVIEDDSIVLIWLQDSVNYDGLPLFQLCQCESESPLLLTESEIAALPQPYQRILVFRKGAAHYA